MTSSKAWKTQRSRRSSKKKGETYFREREKDISRWLKKSVKDSIISIGGGFYQVGNLQKIGHVIYLESSFDAILERIHACDNTDNKLKKRPLLQDMKKAKKLMNERHPKYLASADTVIHTAGKDSAAIAKGK